MDRVLRTPDLTAFQVFLFDLDGTLIDGSDRHFVQCVCETAKEFGHADFRIPAGAPLRQYIRQNWEGATEEFILEFSRRNRERMILTPRPVRFHEDTRAFALTLPEAKRAVVTNCHDWELELTEKALDLRQLFPVVIFKEGDIPGKPSPDLYFKAALHFGVTPDQCLVFEDSATGIIAGKRAGMTVVGIDRGVHSDFGEADYVVSSFLELLS